MWYVVKVQSPSVSFLLTAVYTPPQFHKRKFFWEYLQNLALHVSLPWVLLGDFNDMISDEEKLGGLPVNRTRMSAFRNCMDNCGLIDLGFHGPRYTWTNKSPCWHTTIREWLDRGLGNAEWATLFPTAESTISLGSSLTIVPFFYPLIRGNENPPSPLGLSKCGSLTPPSLPL